MFLTSLLELLFAAYVLVCFVACCRCLCCMLFVSMLRVDLSFAHSDLSGLMTVDVIVAVDVFTDVDCCRCWLCVLACNVAADVNDVVG